MAEKKVVKNAVKPVAKATKTSVAKKTAAVEKKAVVKVEVPAKAVKKEAVLGTLKIAVLGTDGKETGTMMLPEAIFGAKVNPVLMAQAVRVYLANQRQGNAVTLTRGEVTGSTRKIYRQKGTGRARHGGVRAPIFVKGGIAHGPKLRDYGLSMPTKMKRAALFSALTTQLQNGNIVVVAGLEKSSPKTKNMARALSALYTGKKALVVMPKLIDGVYKAGRNIQGIVLSPAQELSAYAVLGAGKIVLMKEAVEALEKTFLK